MRAKEFLHKIVESTGDGEVANTVVAEVIKLIGEGHTEVSPDVVTTKVSAALGRPFMLKDLVAANNASPELQHYIDSINPSKIKFSTDILTVKNQDPIKDKQAAQDGVAKMAARASNRPRLGEGWGAETAEKRHREQMTAVAKVLQKYKNDPVKSKIANYLHVNNWSGPAIEKELARPDVQAQYQRGMDQYERQVGPIKDWSDSMAQEYLQGDQGLEEEKRRLDPKCWKGYRKQGTKMKGDVRVNNCVKIKK